MLLERLKTPPEVEACREETKKVFLQIAQLCPQNPNSLINYSSQTLASFMLERAESNFRLAEAAKLLNLGKEETLKVYFFPKSGKPDSLWVSKGYSVSLRVDFDPNNFQQEKIALDDSLVVEQGPLSPPAAKDNYFLLQLFEAIRDDLKTGRERWIVPLREARAKYFSEKLTEVHKHTPRIADRVVSAISDAFQDKQFAVFGGPVEKKEGKTPKIRLFTTLPLNEQTAERVSREYQHLHAYKLPQQLYERKLHNNGVFRLIFPDFEVSLEHFYPAMRYQPSGSEAYPKVLWEKDGDITEMDFENFIRGVTTHEFYPVAILKKATLLAKNPNQTPVGKLFEEDN